MTNYNDGNWHGWNGGECPVHPDSVGDLTYWDGVTYSGAKMGQFDWSIPMLFRVIKEHREPREWWINPEGRGVLSYDDAEMPPPWVRVQEVIK